MSKRMNGFPVNDWTKRAIWSGFVAMAALMALGFSGCDEKGPQGQAPPPPPVTVSNPVSREVIEWDTYTGHLEAPESVNMVARVSGLITEAPFVEGALVKKGDVLIDIDDRPFKADLDSKQAELERMEAQQAVAKLTYDRVLGLGKDKAVSQQDIDNAKSAVDQANAQVASAKAAVDLSKLNLEWTKVVSPIDGRVSSKLVTVGNLVNGGAGQATLLTTIQSVSPIYCYVDVDESSELKYEKLARENRRVSARDAKVTCYLQLGNETGFPHQGYVDFVDNHVDSNTGTLRARGVFENKLGYLTPGFYAKMCVPGSGKYQALLVPEDCVGDDQNQRFVLLVDSANKVERRPVQLGATFGQLRAVQSGLKPDDRVIINGQVFKQAGMTVDPKMGEIKVDPAVFTDPSAAAAAAATAPTTGAAAGGESATAPASQPATGPATGGNGQ